VYRVPVVPRNRSRAVSVVAVVAAPRRLPVRSPYAPDEFTDLLSYSLADKDDVAVSIPSFDMHPGNLHILQAAMARQTMLLRMRYSVSFAFVMVVEPSPEPSELNASVKMIVLPVQPGDVSEYDPPSSVEAVPLSRLGDIRDIALRVRRRRNHPIAFGSAVTTNGPRLRTRRRPRSERRHD
jgi:hypothetical protein